MTLTLKQAAIEIISVGHFLDARGWAPATAGNYSVRLKNGLIAVTTSGKWKGALKPNDIMTVDREGKPKSKGKPSAETLLHTMLYNLYPQVNAVLHSHSVPCITLTRLLKNAPQLVLSEWEMLKVFPDITTHETHVNVPILPNSQEMAALGRRAEKALRDAPKSPVFLIRGHGLY